jgi:hypothetical protein
VYCVLCSPIPLLPTTFSGGGGGPTGGGGGPTGGGGGPTGGGGGPTEYMKNILRICQKKVPIHTHLPKCSHRTYSIIQYRTADKFHQGDCM